MIPPVHAQMRDFHFEIHDSCNCWDCCKDDDPRVYVNSHGVVEKFDPRKASNQQNSMQRSISNLRVVIEQVAEARQENKKEVTDRVEEAVCKLDAAHPHQLSLDVIRKIQSLVNVKRQKANVQEEQASTTHASTHSTPVQSPLTARGQNDQN